jgi:hypothetical protein
MMMQRSVFFKSLLVCLAAYAQGPDSLFRPKQMKNYEERSQEGRCVLRVWIDDEADVELQGDHVRIRVIAGQAGRDDGSECSQPLPEGGFTRFQWRGIDGRGEVRLVQEPRPGNNYTAIVAIRDKRAGGEGYTFELSWSHDGSRPVQAGSAQQGQPSGPQRTAANILPDLGRSRAPSPGASSYNEILRGTGTLRLGASEQQLVRAWLNLQAGGAAEVVVYGDEVIPLLGRWTESGPDRIDLEIKGGYGEAAGRGRVLLRAGKPEALQTDATSARTGRMEIRFDAARQ